jgi:hypothetical protein
VAVGREVLAAHAIGRCPEKFLADFAARVAGSRFAGCAQNSTLSYLPAVAGAGIELAEISRSGHFPLYTNPVGTGDRQSAFIERA